MIFRQTRWLWEILLKWYVNWI